MKTHLGIIRTTYEGTSQDNAKHLKDALATEATWTEATGFPYAGTYTGHQEIFANVFQKLATEWVGYAAKVHTYLRNLSGNREIYARQLRPSLSAGGRQDRQHGAVCGQCNGSPGHAG